jgi:glycosyltransferase involved in cell wall biosynthesis
LRVTEFCRPAVNVPVVRNVLKNERLWMALGDYLAERLRADEMDLVHAQHVMTTVPSIRAGLATETPVVATVRDYWPVCYWSDLIYDPSAQHLCPHCTATMMTKCVKPRAGPASLAAWPLIPYMRRNLRTKRQTLARASAVIAVSHALADDLRARAPELAATPLYTIPNPVDMTEIDKVHDTAPRPQAEPYLLYAGKLATNKGVQFLIRAVKDAGVAWPLVIAGDGPLRADLERDAAAAGIALRVLGWIDRRETLTWMRHASALAFPSYGPESLSRVLIEAAALGVPIAAMETGGTKDIIRPDVTGLLSPDPDAFSRDLARLANDELLRGSLGRGGSRRRARPLRRGLRRRARRAGLSVAAPSASRMSADRAPLRVAVVARATMPLHGVGGLERSVRDLVRHLAARGVHVTLITPPASASHPTSVDPFASPNILLRHVSYVTFPFANRRGTTILDRSTAYLVFGRRAGRLALQLARDGEVDLVHGFGASVLGYAMARVRPAPLVFNPQGLEEFGASGTLPFGKRVGYAPLRQRCAAVRERPTAFSRRTCRSSRWCSGTFRRGTVNCIRFPNGIDLVEALALAGPAEGAILRQRHGIGAGEIVLLSVGRLEQNKGFDVMATALGQAGQPAGRSRRSAGAG